MPELVRAIAGSLRDGARSSRCSRRPRSSSRFPGVERIEPGDIPGRPARFTTRELLEVEREALELATAGRDVGAPAADETNAAANAASTATCSREQQRLVREAALSRDRSSASSASPAPARRPLCELSTEVYRESGVPVIGAAPSGRAADELANATGIPSSTLHRLLLDADRDGGLPARLRAGRRRSRDGRDARARTAPASWSSGRREGDPGRRPVPAARGRRGRPLPGPLRAARRDRTDREPPPARPLRAASARPAPRPATPSPTSPTPPSAAASSSTTTRPSPSSGCSRTGGRPPAHDPRRR